MELGTYFMVGGTIFGKDKEPSEFKPFKFKCIPTALP